MCKVELRVEGVVRNQAVYLAIAINLQGLKEVLGIWIGREAKEGAKFWLGVLSELKQRGLEDVFIFCVDGLKGFPEAIEQVYPHSQTQLCIVHLIRICIVHLIRNSMTFVPWTKRKAVAHDLKSIYNAPNEQQAQEALTPLCQNAGGGILRSWFLARAGPQSLRSFSSHFLELAMGAADRRLEHAGGQ